MSLIAPFAATTLAYAGQDRPADLYAPPLVRPFEPPSNFGRVEAEGDGGGDPRRRPIVAPVVVEAYVRSYEHAPSGADSAYDRGVDGAEAAMDARMGPLDGLWRLIDDDGGVLAQLALSDRGPGRPVEGAWRKLDAQALLTPIDAAERDTARLTLRIGGSRLDLVLSQTGWAGSLVENGRARAVRLVR